MFRVCVERCEYEINEGLFWRKVAVTPSCWLWMAGTCKDGYGRFNIRKDGRKQPDVASRVAWMLLRGPIPDEIHVLHDCPGGDNPLCVNPDHLWLGTNADNHRDKITKGRQGHGGNYKITAAQITLAKSRRSEGVSIRRTAKEIGCDSGHLSRILRGLAPYSGTFQGEV